MILAAISLDRSISIHAPTRGATSRFLYPLLACFISIHAPTRGATLFPYTNLPNPEFQSTLLQEERLFCNFFTCPSQNFNPRSYKRSDAFFCENKSVTSYFNPRSYKRSDSKNAQYSSCISAIIIA